MECGSDPVPNDVYGRNKRLEGTAQAREGLRNVVRGQRVLVSRLTNQRHDATADLGPQARAHRSWATGSLTR